MDGEKLIQKAMDYVADLFRGDAGGHDAQHTMRVFRNAMAIAEQEGLTELSDEEYEAGCAKYAEQLGYATRWQSVEAGRGVVSCG